MTYRLNTVDEVQDWLTRINLQADDLLQEFSCPAGVEAVIRAFRMHGILPVPSRDGEVASVFEGADVQDYSHRTGDFDFHTDGLYREDMPEFVLLYCESPGSRRICTSVADTSLALSLMPETERQILSQLELVYLDANDHSYRRPLVGTHPRSGRAIVHLGARAFVRSHVQPDVPTVTLRQSTAAVQGLFAALTKSVVREKSWHKGDILLFDNNRYLHRRHSGGDRDPQRVLLRVWLSFQRRQC